MKYARQCILSVLCALLFIQAKAQNEADALRYSFHDNAATARSLGMAGAYGAVGADLSNFFSNPAGIGLYKRGGFEFSLGLSDQLANTNYMNQNSTNSKTHLNLNNFGFIGNKQPANRDWRSVNFGIAYSKTNTFYENISIKGTTTSSLMMPFSIQADGISPNDLYNNLPFTAGLAYDVGGIVPTDSTGAFYVPTSEGENKQSKNITRKGSQRETSFGMGANYRDVLYLGGTINLQGLAFTENSNYNESFNADQQVTELTFTENLRTTGTGINMKLGVIVKPMKWMRVGFAYHTRARILLHDVYTTKMTSRLNGSNYDDSSPELITDYVIRTPDKMIASAAFQLGKMGIVSADYEYSNYNQIRMAGSTSNDYNYEAENKTIQSIYRSTHKAKIGLEIRVFSYYYLRTGMIYQQNPINYFADTNTNPYYTYSGGFGYRNDKVFADFGMNYTKNSSSYYLYDPKFVQAAKVNNQKIYAVLSLGVRF